jgi:hypothetical protein
VAGGLPILLEALQPLVDTLRARHAQTGRRQLHALAFASTISTDLRHTSRRMMGVNEFQPVRGYIP